MLVSLVRVRGCGILALPIALFLLTATPATALARCGNGTLESNEDCDDGNLEAGDCCSPACTYEEIGSTCTPTDACSVAGMCDDGECVGDEALVCDDENPCTTDYCDAEAGCLAEATEGCCTVDSECDDSIVCNGLETCSIPPTAGTGSCVAGAPIACDDRDPCTRDSCVVAQRGCVFAPDEDGVGCVADDFDTDGVWDRFDDCPDTPAGLPVRSDGCAFGDYSEAPLRLIDASTAYFEELDETFFSPDELKRERALTAKVRKLAEQAAYKLGNGQSCSASRTFVKAEKLHERTLRSLDKRRAKTFVRAAKLRGAEVAATGGAATPEEVEAAYYEIASVLAQRAAEAFIHASDVAAAVCRVAVAEKLQAIVTETPGGRRLLLGDGTFVRTAGASITGALLPGVSATVIGERVGASDIVAGKVVVSLNPKLELAPFDITDCYELAIAPVQPEEELETSPLLHSFAGYRFTGTPSTDRHYLERGMALYIRDKGCTPPDTEPDGEGNYIRYSANIFAKTKAFLSSTTVNANAYDIGLDQWWKLADSLNGQGELRVKWYARQCNTGNTPFECDQTSLPQTGLIREQVYKISVAKTGHYCLAEYDATEFALPDRDPAFDDPDSIAFGALFARFEPAEVVGVNGLVTLMGGTQNFSARAYRVTGATTSTFPDLEPVGQNEAFAIYPTRDPYWIEEGDQGVTAAAGVAWPGVAGVRNGKDYRYACLVPRVVRDLVNECPQAPDSYYRLPYFADVGNIQCGQGNNSDLTHCGEGYPEKCGGKYAFDFSIPDGRPVVAARSGTVIDTYSSAQASCFDKSACNEESFFCCVASTGGGICTAGHVSKLGQVCHANEDCDGISSGPKGACRCKANTVAIEHTDGTVGIYLHMRQDGLEVTPGDYVVRGDRIGATGNTGCSRGPHVHFQTIGKAGGTTAWEKASREMRFPTSGGGTCVIPVTGQRYTSNNASWLAFP